MLSITHDPAMLLWLNGADSNKWAVNENYAREVMELFCLGNDPTLEAPDLRPLAKLADVHAGRRPRGGSRAHRLAVRLERRDANGAENPTFYDPTYHDTGSKTIFGKKGNWAWQDVVQDDRRPPQPRAVHLQQDLELLHPDAAVQGGAAR